MLGRLALVSRPCSKVTQLAASGGLRTLNARSFSTNIHKRVTYLNVVAYSPKRAYSTAQNPPKDDPLVNTETSQSETEHKKENEDEKSKENTDQQNTGGPNRKQQVAGFANAATAFVTVIITGLGVLAYSLVWLAKNETGPWALQTTGTFIDEHLFAHIYNFFETTKNNIYGLAGVPRERLILPAALPEGYGRKYTIVLDMETLAEYVNKNGGWLLLKRAGADFFLMNLFKNYEVVLYSKEYTPGNQQALYKLDPTGIIFSHQKFRESGLKDEALHFTGDWKSINRNEKRLIFIDSSAQKYPHDNVIFVGKAESKKPDTVLIDLVQLLNDFVIRNEDDVRAFVKALQTDDPKATINDYAKRKVNPTAPPPQVPVKVQPVETANKGGGFFGFFSKS